MLKKLEVIVVQSVLAITVSNSPSYEQIDIKYYNLVCVFAKIMRNESRIGKITGIF
jgi:hypothetical protein